jgi:XTP/dITP diphosphohydrolase
MKILLATGNTHKRDEIQSILTEHEILVPGDLNLKMDVEESGSTYQENSYIKAEHLYNIAGGIPVLADDSGISVDYLNGEPGIYSARFGDIEAGRILTQEEKNNLLLEKLKGVDTRKASFICCMTLILSPNRVYTIQEEFKGEITTEPYGGGGFGYDPIFMVPELGKTAAQLTAQEKNSISHRGRALKVLKRVIND